MMGMPYYQEVPYSVTTSNPENLRISNFVFSSRDIRPVAYGSTLPTIHIEKGFLIVGLGGEKARVLNSLYIKLQFVQERFIATSGISDVYEEGETPKETVVAYLRSLVDELLWFQQHEEILSRSILNDFRKLQLFVDLV